MNKMEEAEFDKNIDRLFSVGDLIDRGPDSLKCLRLIDEPWFYPVVGNHEDMMCRYFYSDEAYSWRMNGGDWIDTEDQEEVRSYADKIIANVPISRVVCTTGGHLIGISHAQPYCDTFIATGDEGRGACNTMLWGRTLIKEERGIEMTDVVKTFHGHTPVEEVVGFGDQIYIDTGAVFGGDLAFINIK